MRLLAGTFTRGTNARGIYRLEMDPAGGGFSGPPLLAAANNPTWLARCEDRILVANEHADADGSGQISILKLSPAGCTEIQRLSSHGADPCHLAVSPQRLAVANYSGGTVALYEWNGRQAGGLVAVLEPCRTGPHERQQAPHPHGVYFLGGELLVPDLGGDCIHRHHPATGALLGRTDAPAGSGPRHLAPDGRHLVTELHNTVIPLGNDGCGEPVSTLPAGHTGPSSVAEVQRRGAFLYVSNRGHDSIAVFRTEPALELLQHRSTEGGHPRHFLIAPDGRHLLVANRDSDSIVCLAIRRDGLLGDTLSELRCPSPMHLLPV